MKNNNTKEIATPEKANNGITRKDALKKAGKYAVVTAAAMLIILSPKESQAQSAPTPGW